MLGVSTSASAEITNIESDGFWLLIESNEYFVPFDRYPDFRKATISQIFHFEQDSDELHWPELDIDIELDALAHPEQYPLIFERKA